MQISRPSVLFRAVCSLVSEQQLATVQASRPKVQIPAKSVDGSRCSLPQVITGTLSWRKRRYSRNRLHNGHKQALVKAGVDGS